MQKIKAFFLKLFSSKFVHPVINDKLSTAIDDKLSSFNFTNKEWTKVCRDVNGKNKLINLDKNAFKNRVELTVKHFKELQTKTAN